MTARPIRDTAHLATVVAGARKQWGRQRLHPATKTFLALRIAVNREMEELGQFLSRVPATMNSGGRWVVLTYHSREDRLVKQAFQEARTSRNAQGADQTRESGPASRRNGRTRVREARNCGARKESEYGTTKKTENRAGMREFHTVKRIDNSRAGAPRRAGKCARSVQDRGDSVRWWRCFSCCTSTSIFGALT